MLLTIILQFTKDVMIPFSRIQVTWYDLPTAATCCGFLCADRVHVFYARAQSYDDVVGFRRETVRIHAGSAIPVRHQLCLIQLKCAS